jgi:hypothetical protein
MLRLLYTQATTAAQSAPSRVPMPVSAPTRRLLHDGPGLAMAQPRAHPYLGDGDPSADYLQRSRTRGSGRLDVLWAKRFRSVPALRRRSRRRRTASRELAQRVDLVPCAKCVQQNSAHSRESGIQAKDLGPCNGVPATRASRGAPRGDEERGVVFAATREPKYPFIRCSLFGRSNPREQALWTPSIATS